MKARRKSPMTAGKVAIQRKKQSLQDTRVEQEARYQAAMRGLQEYRKELEQEFDTCALEYTYKFAELQDAARAERNARRILQRKLDNGLSYMTALTIAAAAGWGLCGVEVARRIFGG